MSKFTKLYEDYAKRGEDCTDEELLAMLKGLAMAFDDAVDSDIYSGWYDADGNYWPPFATLQLEDLDTIIDLQLEDNDITIDLEVDPRGRGWTRMA